LPAGAQHAGRRPEGAVTGRRAGGRRGLRHGRRARAGGRDRRRRRGTGRGGRARPAAPFAARGGELAMVEVLYYAIPFFILLLIVEYLSFRFDRDDDLLGYEPRDTRTS